MKKSLLFAMIAAIGMSASAATGESVTWTLTPTTSAPVSTTGYAKRVSGSSSNFVSISCPAANIKNTGSGIELHCGGSLNAVYTLTSNHPGYTVTGFSLTLSTNAASTNTIIIDGVETALNSTDQAFTGAGNTFTIKGKTGNDNKDANSPVASSISVTLAPTDRTSAIPSESGWYEIYHLWSKGSSDFVGQQVYNVENEVLHNGGSYSLGVTPSLAKPASKYVYIEVDGDNRYIKSSNGHYVKQNVTSSLEKSDNTTNYTTTFTAQEFGTVRVGGYWVVFTNQGPAMIGQSSSGNDASRCAVFKANPEADYDIWSVTITGGSTEGLPHTHTRVGCTNAENKGVSKVFNNGKFFITKGTELSVSDFVTEPCGENWCPIVTVDNTAKTVVVDYTVAVPKDKYLARLNELVDQEFAVISAQASLYGEESVQQTIEDMKAAAAAAAGEDESVDLTEMAAIHNVCNFDLIRASANTFNKNLDGAKVRIRNVLTSTEYMCVSSAANSDINGATTADKTNPSTIWVLSVNDAGQVKLQNYFTQKYLNSDSSNRETIMTLGDEGHYYTMQPIYTNNGTVAAFEFNDRQTEGAYHYLHRGAPKQGSTEGRIIKWETATNSPGSAWIITLADDETNAGEVTATTAFEATSHSITIASGAGALTKHTSYADHMVITVTPVLATEVRAASEPITLTHESCTEEDGAIKIDLGKQLEEGSYTINVPTAMFKVGSDKYSKAMTSEFSVTGDGSTVGIDEIGVNKTNANGAIYDLQGRRLSAPVKGINIINGRKVLVK